MVPEGLTDYVSSQRNRREDSEGEVVIDKTLKLENVMKNVESKSSSKSV